MFCFYKKKYDARNKKVVILLSGWKGLQSHYWLFSKIIKKNGYSCLTYTYDKEILHPDPKETVKNISLVVEDILQEVSLLKKNGISDITILGTSVGSVPAILAANKTNDIHKLILNTSGYDIAETIWSWNDIIKRFKKEMIRRGVTLEQLKKELESINPKNNLQGLKNKKILLLSSRNDKIIPFEQAEKLRKKLEEINESTMFRVTNHFGHCFYGAINLLKASQHMTELQNSMFAEKKNITSAETDL